MRKLLSLFLVTLIIVALFYWISGFDSKKYDDFEEAIKIGIPYEVNQIIHTEKYDNVTVVMYTTLLDKEDLPRSDPSDWEGLGVAFFTGNDEEGWKNIGHNGWRHSENKNMTVYFDSLHEDDYQGNKLHEFYLLYGKINNPDIAIIETKSKKEDSFEKTAIIEQGNRYYFKVGKNKETVVRGLSKSGDVLDIQGG
ncbi:hypothetical protein RZN22_08250 [Bacillaceae bacterium S4-13-58]